MPVGISSAEILAPSAFLASAASTPSLHQSILPDCIKVIEDQSVTATEEQWTAMPGSAKPATEWQHIQKAWDGLVAKTHETQLLSQASFETDGARLLADSSTHSGDWLHAAPIVSTVR